MFALNDKISTITNFLYKMYKKSRLFESRIFIFSYNSLYNLPVFAWANDGKQTLFE